MAVASAKGGVGAEPAVKPAPVGQPVGQGAVTRLAPADAGPIAGLAKPPPRPWTPAGFARAAPGVVTMSPAAIAVAFLSYFALAFFLLALMLSVPLRRWLAEAGRAVYRPARALVVDVPLWLVRVPWLRRLVKSWPMHLLHWYVFKPLLLSALVWLLIPATVHTFLAALGTFVAVNVLVNSRPGQAVAESFLQGLANLVQMLGSGLIPGLVHWIVRVFKHITDMVEYLLFSVDEWLRFRRGDTRTAMVVRTILGLFWFPISYVARFYMVVLIEPTLNPLKLPIASIAYKFTILATPWLLAMLVPPLTGLIGYYPAYAFVIVNTWLLPDAFAFLVWEMKENWKLYRANRALTVKPVALGSHGETMRRLLQPGFHSGTIPKVYSRLRAAERRAYHSGSWRPARAYRQRLEEVAEAIRRFVERELLSLLEQSTAWQGKHLSAGRVSLATNRISIELTHASFPGKALGLEFKVRAGWLMADVRERAWLDQLPRERLTTLLAGLAYLYKRAGVDLVRELLRANLPAAAVSYDITSAGLALWADPRHGPAVVYDLGSPDPKLEPRAPDGAPAPGWPALEAQRLVYGRVPLTWEDWVRGWEEEQHLHVFPGLPSLQLDLAGLGETGNGEAPRTVILRHGEHPEEVSPNSFHDEKEIRSTPPKPSRP
jgi:hypothetical protein